MINFLPSNIRELISILVILVGIIFSFISIIKTDRDYILRITALFLLTGIALFANNPYCYFATIFIIATAVTQLEFLQNLAAIIRGSKEYFDYQKEFISQKEVAKTIKKEIEGSGFNDLTNRNDSLKIALITEEYTFKYIERIMNRPIHRHVRFKAKNIDVRFDGFMQFDRIDVLFEIRLIKLETPKLEYKLRENIKRLAISVSEYQNITNRAASLNYVIVGDYDPKIIQIYNNIIDEVSKDHKDVEMVLKTYSFEEIGLEIKDLFPAF